MRYLKNAPPFLGVGAMDSPAGRFLCAPRMTMGTIHMMIKNINLGLAILPPPGSEAASTRMAAGIAGLESGQRAGVWGPIAGLGPGPRPLIPA